MTVSKLLEKGKTGVQKIGKRPVVVLPLAIWREIEQRLEDGAILESKNLAGKIARSRKEEKMYSSAEVKKMLGV